VDQGELDLAGRLANPCVNYFRAITACLPNAIQLPAADNVEPAAGVSHKLEYIDIAAGLDGIADGRIGLAIGLLNLLQMVYESGLTVDIDRRAHVSGNFLNIHVFSKQPTVFIIEVIHITYSIINHQ